MAPRFSDRCGRVWTQLLRRATLQCWLVCSAAACASAHEGQTKRGGDAETPPAPEDAGAVLILSSDAAADAWGSGGTGCKPGESVEVPSACADGRSCLGVCFDHVPRTFCSECDAAVPDCPEDVPVQGASCAQLGASCPYARCATEGLVQAVCRESGWQLGASACIAPQCWFGEDGAGKCALDDVCTLGEAFAGMCPGDGRCMPSPCQGKPFTCACAATLCGPYHVCQEAAAGEVHCVANRSLTALPQQVAGPDGAMVSAGNELCSSVACVDPDTQQRRALPAGLGWVGMKFYRGYLYGSSWQKLSRMPIEGGPLETLAETQATTFDFYEDQLFFALRDAAKPELATLVQSNLDGTAQQVLAGPQTNLSNVQVLDGVLHWETSGGWNTWVLATGARRTLPLPSGVHPSAVVAGRLVWQDPTSQQLQLLDLASGAQSTPSDLRGRVLGVEGNQLYIASSKRASELLRLDFGPGTPQMSPPLAFSSSAFADFTLTGTALYWHSCGTVMRIAK